MNKKGELTSKQIVTIVILVVSFSVILIFFFALNLKGQVSDDACRNSVELASSPIFGAFVKLNCETRYVCLSSGGDCQIQTKDTETIKISSDDFQNGNEELFLNLAELTRDCYWKMGGGQADLKGRCVICSVVEFDDKIKSLSSLSKEEFFKYMERTRIIGQEKSYLDYLYKTQTAEIYRAMQGARANTANWQFGKIDVSKQQMVVYSYKSGDTFLGIGDFDALKLQGLECDEFSSRA